MINGGQFVIYVSSLFIYDTLFS